MTRDQIWVCDDYQALLRGVLVDPADDLPRLVLADWIDENADRPHEIGRAEFIRDQCELAKLEPSRPRAVPMTAANEAIREHREHLRLRQSELLAANETLWSRPWRTKSDLVAARGVGVCCDRDAETHACDCLANAPEFTWSRGFASGVTLTLAAFAGGPCGVCGGGGLWRLGHSVIYGGPRCRACQGTGRVAGSAEALFATHPITRVVLTDRRPMYGSCPPYRGPETWMWAASDEVSLWTIPPDIAAPVVLPGHDTEAAAHDWLSARCVAYGRRLAGLTLQEGQETA